MRWLLAVISLGGSLGAQDEFIPTIDASGEPVALPFGETGDFVEGDDTEILVEGVTSIQLLGIEGHSESIASPRPLGEWPVEAGGLTVAELPELQRRLTSYVNRPLSERDLLKLTEEIIRHYEERDRPVVDVVVTGVEEETLLVEVAEGRVGELRLKDAEYFNEELLADALSLRSGDLLRASALEEDLVWLGRNPFRQAELFAAPGREAGEADLLIGLEEENPWLFSLGWENTGTEATGEERLIASILWGNAWDADQVLAYRATLGWDVERFQAHGFSWEVPLHQRHEFLRFSGSWARVRTDSDFGSFVLEAEGESWQLGVSHGRPIHQGDWRGELSWGAEFKRSDTFLAVGAVEGPGVPVEVVQGRLDVLLRRDTFELRGTLVASPGGLSGRNGSEDFSNYRPDAEAAYLYARVSGSWLHALGDGWALLARGESQLATGALLPSEQLGFGGSSSVRGYAERELLADQGGWLSLELRSPALDHNWLGDAGQLQAIGFLDGGLGWQDGEGGDVLLGTGLGLRGQWKGAGFRVDVGIPLEGEKEVRLHAGLQYQW
ncbi:MAG: ShlB/FhaC/HecB family hemolysin secretion/activation protein [Verrucomicrobiota bacterium JB023]|nr:ShlB/FhaC/HecB family hemolysin secretion/activation protein [Verrucomicrobiota bacterium JB023]